MKPETRCNDFLLSGIKLIYRPAQTMRSVAAMFDEMVEATGKFAKKVDEGCEDVNTGVSKYFTLLAVSLANIFLLSSLNPF